MPPTTRRSTGGARARPGLAKGGQSTLSFSSKVTKSVPKDIKNAVVSPAVAKIPTPTKTAPEEEDVKEVAVDEPAAPEEADVEPQEEEPAEKSEAELKAEKIGDAQIRSYWKSVETQRKAPQVHQQGLDVSERVLRYFDVSSQYGVSLVESVHLRRHTLIRALAALHWYRPNEAVAESRAAGPQPAHRSACRASFGGEKEYKGH